MKIIESSLSKIDLLINAFKKVTMSSLEDYSNLDTAITSDTIMTEDGSYVTLFEIKGINKIVSAKEVKEFEESFNLAFGSLFSQEGVEMQICYFRNPEETEKLIRNSISKSVLAAKQIGFSSLDYFDNKVDYLKKFIVKESVYLAVWTKPLLIGSSIKADKEENTESNNLYKGNPFFYSQNPLRFFKTLYTEHSSIISNIENSLKEDCFVAIEKLTVKDAAQHIRKCISHDLTSDDWEPVVPYEDYMATDSRKIYQEEEDISNYLWPRLNEQVFPEDASYEDANTISFNDTYFSSFFVKIPSTNENITFNSFLNKIDKRIPFAASFNLTSDGRQGMALKSAMASILAIVNADNRKINDAISYLNWKADDKNEAVIKFNMNFATWSKSKDDLRLKLASLVREVQSWGKQSTKIVNDDPFMGFLSTIPGLSNNKAGASIVPPLHKIIHFLPFMRPANLWDTGLITFRTDDYKLIPYEPMSSKQKYWNDIIFAEPGSGKSVLLQMLVLAKVLSPAIDKTVVGHLPHIGILDIGFSSRGVISLLKDLLPEEKKDQVLHRKLTFEEKDSVNMFDTQLGCRYPSQSQKSFLTNFLTTITMNDDGTSIKGISKMLVLVIDKLYEYFSDDKNPKLYEPSKNKKLNNAIEKLGVNTHNASWWQIVDDLFDKKQYKLAAIAQRYAVPVLKDVIKVTQQTESLKDFYGETKDVQGTGETLLKALIRSITEAEGMFPNLSRPTILDIESAKIVALDLQDVTDGSADTAVQVQKNAIMYLAAREIISKNFYLGKDLIQVAPDKYKAYHVQRIKNSQKLRKSLFYDEFHRTNGVLSVREQVFRDMREGRKHKVGITLASQNLDDFPKNMQSMSSGIFILDNNKYKEIAETFDLSDSEKQTLRMMSGAKGRGVSFMSIFRMKNSRSVQKLVNTLSPYELWSFNSSADDNRLKEDLEVEFGSGVARKLLAQKFPEGELAPFLEELEKKTDDPEILGDKLGYIKKLLRREYKLLYSVS